MKQGDFTDLAKNYINRPDYSNLIMQSLLKIVDFPIKKNNFKVADVGAGTGKMTKVLLELGLNVDAVEPNSEMRKEGVNYTKDYNIIWTEGSGEKTNLKSDSYDWAIMASSFHWTDHKKSLPEFYRILKPDSYFTIIWNPRNIEKSPIHLEIEEIIYRNLPSLKRVSSGGKSHTKNWEDILIETGHFKDVIFTEVEHNEIMSIERYMGIWKSVNDIRAQAGEVLFNKILIDIESKINYLKEINVPYKMRSWTAKRF
jgi:ubiquinone/menaquinone biosynthesis C-methylase UbiE